MNWGTKLAIGMAIFIGFIVTLIVLMFRSESDALVDNDYYEKGIHYNKDYDKKENVKRDNAAPVVFIGPDSIKLSFKKQAQGSLTMIRTADKRLDQAQPLQTDVNYEFKIPLQHFAKGLWKLQLEWQSDGKSYLYEKEVMLP
jgi:hypothetical protein